VLEEITTSYFFGIAYFFCDAFFALFGDLPTTSFFCLDAFEAALAFASASASASASALAFALVSFTFLVARVPGDSATLCLVVRARRFPLPRGDVRIPGEVGIRFFGGMTTQEHNKEAATVSPVVLISSKYEIQQKDNANNAVNLLASLHQVPDVGSV
jgi:hypothetical protein